MEERLQPSSYDPKDKPPHPPQPAAPSLATYVVVQIPRDQIYRVPPPEHARIIEDHKRNSSSKKNGGRSTVCRILIPIVVVAVIITVAVYALRVTLYDAKSPVFTVAGIQAKNLEASARRPALYDVTLSANNPNTRMTISYQVGGKVGMLALKNQEIGRGGIQPKVTQESGVSTVDVHVVFSGKGVDLAADTKKKLKDGTSVKSMVLHVMVPVEITSWMRNERKDLNVTCEFKVQNSLTSKAKITSQKCNTGS
ncbi:NDR1/HIN1-like protein 13 [Sesamum alatum]|uniref:NDR1/HIN1-like protein 13 n=1 Tax=Sesamum alatum TaxID=300844 RepID=A0AAE2CCL2_9LAMI|nr:NDR1/HIN1-like protein 13 [Sesamum alatum]